MSSNENITKPTIETVLQRIDALSTRLEEKMDRQHAELRADIRALSKKIDIMNNELLEVKKDNAELSDRIENLERKAS